MKEDTMSQEELLLMSQQDRDRVRVIRQVSEGRLSQVDAALQLDVTPRQVRRLVKRFARVGDTGLVHQLRGKPSNHRFDGNFRRRVLRRYESVYSDFGPTLAVEKLHEDGRVLSDETLRRWLMAEGLWQGRKQGERHRARRERKACCGQMIQTDASHHAWLEDRFAGRIVLVAMIDDATSRAFGRFYGGETTAAYMDLLMRYVGCYGRMVSIYADRHSIFKISIKDAWGEVHSEPTQFARALGELGIGLIAARSPQAKGRIERFFETAQDRLVKELRLHKASTMEQANAVLERYFLPLFNRRFTVPAAKNHDVHRPVDAGTELASILSERDHRVISNDYTFQYGGRIYQIPPPPLPGMRSGRVIVENRLDGQCVFRFGGTVINCRMVKDRGAKPATDQRASPGGIPHPRAATNSRKPKVTHPDPRERFLPGTNPLEGGSWRPGPKHPWRKAALRETIRRAATTTSQKHSLMRLHKLNDGLTAQEQSLFTGSPSAVPTRKKNPGRSGRP
jgi:hypothetical protein